MADAGMPHRAERPRMGAVIGIDFDFGATDFHLRWYLEQMCRRSGSRAHHPQLGAAEAAAWLASLKEHLQRPADRTTASSGRSASTGGEPHRPRVPPGRAELRGVRPASRLGAEGACGRRTRAIQAGRARRRSGRGRRPAAAIPRAVALEHALLPLDEPGLRERGPSPWCSSALAAGPPKKVASMPGCWGSAPPGAPDAAAS